MAFLGTAEDALAAACMLLRNILAPRSACYHCAQGFASRGNAPCVLGNGNTWWGSHDSGTDPAFDA